MKTYGRIAYESYQKNLRQELNPEYSWPFLSNHEKGAWEAIAAEVIAESDQRRDNKDE